MEQLIILTNRDQAFASSKDAPNGMIDNAWYDIVLKNKKHIRINRNKIALYLLKSYDQDTIVTRNHYGQITLTHCSKNPDARNAFQLLLQQSKGKIMTSRNETLTPQQLVVLEFENEARQDQHDDEVYSEDKGKHALTEERCRYIVWTSEKDFQDSGMKYFKKHNGISFAMRDHDLSKAMIVNKEDFDFLNAHGMVYAYYKQYEEFYMPNLVND